MAATRLVIPVNMSLCRERFSLVDMAILDDNNIVTPQFTIEHISTIPDGFICQFIRTVGTLTS